tara:strand:- start:1691 stop:1861 length:171 start_codon:yes stop_codon:yes gene_type:complete
MMMMFVVRSKMCAKKCQKKKSDDEREMDREEEQRQRRDLEKKNLSVREMIDLFVLF